MAGEEDVFISVSLPSWPLSISQMVDWATRLHWWEWLIMAKAMLLFWVLNITVILPSLFMQVMLYTDEMSSRHAPATLTLVWEGHQLLTWAFTPTPNLNPGSKIESRWFRGVKHKFLHARRRRKR